MSLFKRFFYFTPSIKFKKNHPDRLTILLTKLNSNIVNRSLETVVFIGLESAQNKSSGVRNYFSSVNIFKKCMKTTQTFSILIWANKSRASGNQVPIYARVTVDGKRAEISLKKSVDHDIWDSQKGYVGFPGY